MLHQVSNDKSGSIENSESSASSEPIENFESIEKFEISIGNLRISFGRKWRLDCLSLVSDTENLNLLMGNTETGIGLKNIFSSRDPEQIKSKIVDVLRLDRGTNYEMAASLIEAKLANIELAASLGINVKSGICYPLHNQNIIFTFNKEEEFLSLQNYKNPEDITILKLSDKTLIKKIGLLTCKRRGNNIGIAEGLVDCLVNSSVYQESSNFLLRLSAALERESEFFEQGFTISMQNISLTVFQDMLGSSFGMKVKCSPQDKGLDIYFVRDEELGKNICQCLIDDELTTLEKLIRIQGFLDKKIDWHCSIGPSGSTRDYKKVADILKEKITEIRFVDAAILLAQGMRKGQSEECHIQYLASELIENILLYSKPNSRSEKDVCDMWALVHANISGEKVNWQKKLGSKTIFISSEDYPTFFKQEKGESEPIKRDNLRPDEKSQTRRVSKNCTLS